MERKMSEMNELREERLKKIQSIRDMGVDPYGSRFDGAENIEHILEQFSEGRKSRATGRLTAWRSHGKTIFADLTGQNSKIQIFLRKNDFDEDRWNLVSMLDIGDLAAVAGECFLTKTGMQTIRVSEIYLMSKAVRPPAEKWHGLKDVEIRYRQRYLDLASSVEVRELFVTRSKIVSEIRKYLDQRDYLEVETPMMHPIPGGAAGKPFKTHHEALDMELFLRIAPELYLKRLLVGGLEKVYEINKSFRNEGISTRHNPEFTMLEIYTSYSDVEGVMELTENLIRHLAQTVRGSLRLPWQEQEIDFSKFDRVSFADLMKDAYGIHPDDPIETWVDKLKTKGVKIDDKELSRTKLLKIIGDLLEPEKRKHPVFVTDYFTELCPLAKTQKNNPHLSERFELYIGGMEVANGYSELNDPQEQLVRFRSDIEADEENDFEGLVDEDYVKALEYGMPPAGGLGIGVDRLIMILTNQSSIREVVLFPQMKPVVNPQASA